MRAARLRSGEGEGRRRGEPARAQEDECSHPSSHASQFSCLPVLTHLIGHLQCAFFIVQALTHPLLHLLHLRSQVPPPSPLVTERVILSGAHTRLSGIPATGKYDGRDGVGSRRQDEGGEGERSEHVYRESMCPLMKRGISERRRQVCEGSRAAAGITEKSGLRKSGRWRSGGGNDLEEAGCGHVIVVTGRIARRPRTRCAKAKRGVLSD
jgi:hypothetical protein